MSSEVLCSLKKRERIVSKKLMDALFGGNRKKTLSAYPLRMVYLQTDCKAEMSPVQILVSVPKRHLKHAVDRNRVKRQIRESYRCLKHMIVPIIEKKGCFMAIAFLWQSDKIYSTKEVSICVERLLIQLSNKC